MAKVDSGTVNRSSELLSCAKSALKILKAQQSQSQSQSQHQHLPTNLPSDTSTLQLWQASSSSSQHDSVSSFLWLFQEDALEGLRAMQQHLRRLNSLVKQTGHSNNPEQAISNATKRFQTAAQQVSTLLNSVALNNNQTLQVPSPWNRGQARQHLDWVQAWLTAAAQQLAQQLQALLKVRAKVLQQQAARRQQFTTASSATATTALSQRGSASSSKTSSASSSAAAAALAKNPLLQPRRKNNPYQARPLQATATNGVNGVNGHGGGGYATASSSSSSSYYSNGGGSTYGGIAAASNTMRQRKTNAAASNNNNNTNSNNTSVVEQDQFLVVQQQQHQTQSRRRRQDAQQAEQALHSIGQLFGKMSTLVQQQGEVLERVDSDVEAAQTHVQAGQDEITTLYSLKRGNRALILKVFGLLLFLICFLRFYKKK